MTRNEIIEQLYNGKNFRDCLSKMEPDHLREDLRQEVILIVCSWPDEKVIKLHQDKALDFFVVKVILNQIKSNSSPFAKKYRQQLEEFDNHDVPLPDIDHEERELRETIEDIAIEEIDKQYWYNKGLINLYLKHGTYRAVQKETGIPHISVYKTIQKSFKEIKSKVGK